MASNWTLDQLKKALGSDSRIKDWVITQEHLHRRERYFMLDGGKMVVDQDRSVHGQNIYAKLLVDIGKNGRQGEISKKLLPTVPLSDQIESAVQAASQTDHQAWKFPVAIPKELPRRLSADPRMAEDLDSAVEELTRKISESVGRKRETAFNSAELFLSVHDRELHLSNGLQHRQSQSRIYTEAAFSYSRNGKEGVRESDEYLNARWSVNLDDLKIEELFEETSDRAQHSLDVIKPESGNYPVIVDAEVLATLFNNQITQLSAVNAYNGLPFIKPGEELVQKADGSGDLISMSLDPSLDFGADAASISEQGIVQERLELVEDNRVRSTLADKQYADYLGIQPSTVRGDVVVKAGKLTHAELTRQAPKVLEILQFSGLFADANSGTFSSEIRLARLYDNQNGRVTYLKGGSLSGSFQDNFKHVRLSKDLVRHAHFSANQSGGHGYYGPKFALLSDVSIVG